MTGEGEALLLGDTLGDTLADGETLALGLTERLELADGDTDALGETDGLSLLLGDTDALGETERLSLALGLTLALGDTDADGLSERLELALGETEAEGDTLLIDSRMARWTIARSSLVPEDMPTDRLPCPAVVSRTTTKHCEPMSILWSSVLFAPALGGVWWPKCPPANRTLFDPGDPSVTDCSATVLSPVTSTMPAV
jgi:hypothetical protein